MPRTTLSASISMIDYGRLSWKKTQVKVAKHAYNAEEEKGFLRILDSIILGRISLLDRRWISCNGT